MSELFGAPSGTIAWDQNARANAESAANVDVQKLNAQLKLGQLAQAPQDAALLAARTREQNALADQHEVATQVARQQLGFEDAYKAYQKLAADAGDRGEMATWQSLPGIDAPRAKNLDGTDKSFSEEILNPVTSITAPLEQKLAFFQKMGAPASMTTPLIKEIVAAKEKAAITDYRSSQAEEQRQKVAMQRIKQFGGEAAAAAQDDAAYAQLMMKISSSPVPQIRQLASQLKGTDRLADAPQLLAFAQSTLDYETQVKNERAAAKAKLEEQQIVVTKGKAAVAAKVATAQITKLEAQTRALGKDGEGTVNQVAVAEQKAWATYNKLRKERESLYPPAPLDPTYYDRHPGVLVTLKDGSVARVVVQDGKRMWDVVKPPLKEVPPPRTLEDIANSRKTKRAAALAATAEDDTFDDEED